MNHLVFIIVGSILLGSILSALGATTMLLIIVQFGYALFYMDFNKKSTT
jgi:flagellar motor component MotA